MKLAIVVLLVCVSLTQAFNPWGMFKKWKDGAEKAINSSESHQEHAQRLLDEVENAGELHFGNKAERYRHKVGKIWMRFKNKAENNLENAKESIDEAEEELHSSLDVPEHAKKVMKNVRQQTMDIVKSLKKLIHPIKLSREESEFEGSGPIEIPEIFEPESTEEPEVLPETEFPAEPTEVPEVLITEQPVSTHDDPEVFPIEPVLEPEVLPTEVPDTTEDPEVFSTELPEPTQEPEALSTDFPEPEVLPTLEPTLEPETEVYATETQVEPIDEEHYIYEGNDDDDDDDETMPGQQEEYDENEDDDEDGDDEDGDDEIDEDSTEVPTEKENEPEKDKEVHEVVEVAQNIQEEVKMMPKWVNKRQKKLTKLWEKYALRNSKKVLKKIKRLESFLAQKTEEAN